MKHSLSLPSPTIIFTMIPHEALTVPSKHNYHIYHDTSWSTHCLFQIQLAYLPWYVMKHSLSLPSTTIIFTMIPHEALTVSSKHNYHIYHDISWGTHCPFQAQLAYLPWYVMKHSRHYLFQAQLSYLPWYLMKHSLSLPSTTIIFTMISHEALTVSSKHNYHIYHDISWSTHCLFQAQLSYIPWCRRFWHLFWSFIEYVRVVQEGSFSHFNRKKILLAGRISVLLSRLKIVIIASVLINFGHLVLN